MLILLTVGGNILTVREVTQNEAQSEDRKLTSPGNRWPLVSAVYLC